jgi:hypothetical protein
LETGQLLITDASNILSQANGELVASGVAAANSGALPSASFAREAGLALLFTLRRSAIATASRWGWAQSGTLAAAVFYGYDGGQGLVNLRVNDNAVVTSLITPGDGTLDTRVALILRATGCFYAVGEGGKGYVLGWVSNVGSGAVWPAIVAGAGTHGYRVRDFRVVRLAGPWTTDYGLALARSATTANGDTLSGAAYGIFEHTITAATGVTQEFSFRYIDDNNRWCVRMNQGGSTCKLIEITAGVETERDSSAVTWTNGSAYRVAVVVQPWTGAAAAIHVATQLGAGTPTLRNTYLSATAHANATGLKVSHAGTQLIAWPRYAPISEAA